MDKALTLLMRLFRSESKEAEKRTRRRSEWGPLVLPNNQSHHQILFQGTFLKPAEEPSSYLRLPEPLLEPGSNWFSLNNILYQISIKKIIWYRLAKIWSRAKWELLFVEQHWRELVQLHQPVTIMQLNPLSAQSMALATMSTNLLGVKPVRRTGESSLTVIPMVYKEIQINHYKDWYFFHHLV